MEHSMQAYLKRRSTEELDAILGYCLAGEHWQQYEKAVMEIIQILKEREKDIPFEVTPQRQWAIDWYCGKYGEQKKEQQ